MKNYLQEGKAIDIVAPSGGLVGGQYYRVGGLAGVVASDAAEGAVTVLHRKGVYSLPKTQPQTWTLGQPLYWDGATGKFTNVAAAGATPDGVAVPNAAGNMPGSTDTVGAVLIGVAALAVVAGQSTTVAASDTIATGLGKVLSVVASLDSDPVDGAMHATASIGDQAGAPVAGSFLLNTWKSTDADATLVAATTFAIKVNWIAVGYY